MYADIFNFLSFNASELKSKDIIDYKISKAYSYYSTGWLNSLLFYPISHASKFCYLKSNCRSSQRISDVPHKVWVCLSKETGKIMRAHCLCLAGVAQTSNHVAAALFRIEAAVRIGLDSPSCTSKPCKWLSKNKKVVTIKLKNLKLCRNNFRQRGKSGMI